MPGHLTPLATAVKDALDASGELPAAAAALIAAIEADIGGPMTGPRVVDVGARVYVVVMAGGPLIPPETRVHLAPEIS